MQVIQPVYAALPSDSIAYQVLLLLPYLDGVRAKIRTLAEGEACRGDEYIPIFTSAGHYRKNFFCISPRTFAERRIKSPEFATHSVQQVAVNPARVGAFESVCFKEALREIHRYHVRLLIKRQAPKMPRRRLWSPHSECVN